MKVKRFPLLVLLLALTTALLVACGGDGGKAALLGVDGNPGVDGDQGMMYSW